MRKPETLRRAGLVAKWRGEKRTWKSIAEELGVSTVQAKNYLAIAIEQDLAPAPPEKPKPVEEPYPNLVPPKIEPEEEPEAVPYDVAMARIEQRQKEEFERLKRAAENNPALWG